MNDMYTLLTVRDTLYKEQTETREGSQRSGLARALLLVEGLIQKELDEQENRKSVRSINR